MSLLKVISVFFLSLITIDSAFANISTSQTRLFFDQKTRSQALQLRNSSDRPMDYTITLRLFDMTEEGALHPVESSEYSAQNFVRYSPKRGTIPGNSTQAVRFSVRKPAGLANGEYRAVLRMKGTPKQEFTSQVGLATSLAYNLPIVVHHGRLEVKTELKQPRLVLIKDIPHVEFWQTREGNRSLFGDFILTNDKGDEIGALRNAAVYRHLDKRKYTIALREEVSGKLTISYEENAQYGGTEKATISFDVK